MPQDSISGNLPKLNGSGKRKLESWTDAFIAATEGLEAPAIFRKWSAIATIAAALEQKVWVTTTRPLYPNLYVGIIGHPGVGKTRTIRESRALYQALAEPHLAPVSLTFASLVDSLVKAKRMLIRLPDSPLEYNSMFICADELGAFISKYDEEMIAGLSTFYDPDQYSQSRRKWGDEVLKIKSPQLNMLAGSTPTNLLKFIPEGAWDQGFTSRLILVFSDERIVGDDFAGQTEFDMSDLEHDLKIINSLCGKFTVTEDYAKIVKLWRDDGERPKPNHPKLIHYITRRRTHLYKLSMISAIDKGNALILTRDDFNQALNWLHEAEVGMAEIFKAGVKGADGSAMDEIYHFVQINDKGQGISEQRIVRFASERVPFHSILRIIEIMEKSGRIGCVKIDKRDGSRSYRTTASMGRAEDFDPTLGALD